MINIDLLDKLESNKSLKEDEFLLLLKNREYLEEEVLSRASKIRDKHFGNKIYIRGLIEFTNICKNDCYYCGIRKSNPKVNRYRLSKKDLISLIKTGSEIGLKTFVLQGGEDPYFTDSILVEWLHTIKEINPDAAITLSVGERSFQSYKKLREAGGDRFLLRHETINSNHYSKLHPKEMTIQSRVACLNDLKALGFQVGAGFMVGSPYQTLENLAEDLFFLQDLQPEMVGLGPYISHKDTPFFDFKNGSVDFSAFLLGLVRMILPKANIPATTALQSLSDKGREKGLNAGANVLMPNLSPQKNRKNYSLYDNKASFSLEGMENLELLKKYMREIGYEVVMDRGDFKS